MTPANETGQPVPQPSDPRFVQVRDLKPLEDLAHSSPRRELLALTDTELLVSVTNPINDDGLLINTWSGRISDGNGRAWELIRRAADPQSGISSDTLVPVDYYTPDLSMFPDLE
jgi:hypothetical protein